MRHYIDIDAELVGLPGVIETGQLHERLAYGVSGERGLPYRRGAAEINREILRMVADGVLHRVKRGLYVRGSFLPGGAAGLGTASLGELRMLLAGALYGPSYVTGETALRVHGLVRLAAVSGEHCITSVTAGKNRSKSFDTAFGRFAYHDIPQEAFDWGVETHLTDRLRGDEFGAGVAPGEYRLAGPEKALCDAVYLRARHAGRRRGPHKGRQGGQQRGLRNLVDMLYEDIGLDQAAASCVDIDIVWKMQHRYPSSAVGALAGYLYRHS